VNAIRVARVATKLLSLRASAKSTYLDRDPRDPDSALPQVKGGIRR
jgi:hypothetical protein